MHDYEDDELQDIAIDRLSDFFRGDIDKWFSRKWGDKIEATQGWCFWKLLQHPAIRQFDGNKAGRNSWNKHTVPECMQSRQWPVTANSTDDDIKALLDAWVEAERDVLFAGGYEGVWRPKVKYNAQVEEARLRRWGTKYLKAMRQTMIDETDEDEEDEDVIK